MKTRFLTTVILLLAVCITLCGCGIFDAPLGGAEVPNRPKGQQVKIYICGAVQQEGYYSVEVGADYFDAIRLAGILPQSALPLPNTAFVNAGVKRIAVGFYEGGKSYDSVNVNGYAIVNRWSIDGLADSIVNKLADYIDEHGAIVNKQQLKLVLGTDYAANHYKLFVAESDYEEAG